MTVIVTSTATAQPTADNPLLRTWNTPFQTPPFATIRTEHYEPALSAAMADAEKEIGRIARQRKAPTFDNTILALEKLQQPVDRISALLFNLNECNTDPELQQLVIKMAPELTRFSNNMMMNERLFARIKTLHEQRDALGLTVEQLQVLDDWYQAFVRNGVNLDRKQKETYARNAEELAVLSEQFNQNVLADQNAYTLHITNRSDLGGLPDNVVAAAREEAASRGMDGWVFTLDYPSYQPFLAHADNRALREQMWRAYNSRANHGDEHDNNDIARRMVLLRNQQAQLLGYDNYAAYRLSNTMAQNIQNVMDLYQTLINTAYPIAQHDVEIVLDCAQRHGFGDKLMPWDYSYYSEMLRKERYDFDSEQLRPYFQLERVRQGIFDLYGKLYGLQFQENKSIAVYHPDVKAYEVHDASGRFMGVIYLDMFPRASKRGGAWMTEFRNQHKLDGTDVRPLIQVVCNFSKPVGDKPALLSFSEVETFMHEFGHAMHGMLSDVTYPSVSGTSVKHDFVEMPSQVMENWCYEPAFLNTFAKHYVTGDTISKELIDKIRNSENYQAGYLCTRQLNFGIVDMAYHTLDSTFEGSCSDFENKHTLALLPLVPGHGFSTSFTHIFAGGYAAGYYGYKWAEVLDADIFSRFKADGIFNAATAAEFRSQILSRGGSEHPSVLFRRFMGRDPNPDALLLRCGFIKLAEPDTHQKGGTIR